MIEFTRGISDFVGSYGWYAKTPKPMRAALLPAVFVWLVLAGIVVVFAAFLPVIMIAITPFASEWADPWPVIVRVSGGLALLAAVIFVAVKLFASITTLVSERSYERIRESVDTATGSLSTRKPQGFARQLVDVGRSIIVGIPLAIIMFALSLIPIVGVAVSLIAGAVVAGRSLGRDLVMCSVEVPADQLTKAQRRRIAGFGIGAQLGMMIPFTGISAMPAAVAGATALAHRINGQALSGR